MKRDAVILIAEDDDGHFALIKRSLERAGVVNEIVRFVDGQQVLDFLYPNSADQHVENNKEYLLMLDIRMPKVDGVEVLSRIKNDQQLKKLPVIMLTTTDDPSTVDRCHNLGCSLYVVKPVDYTSFNDAIKKIGMFLSVVEVPELHLAG